jgi:SHS family lactate transporter-like MFS transporter
MTVAAAATNSIPWWREPTKDQWLAWWAAWLGWTLDAFDFTVFLLIMVPIAQEFNVPLTEVTAQYLQSPCGCASSAHVPRVGSLIGWDGKSR